MNHSSPFLVVLLVSTLSAQRHADAPNDHAAVDAHGHAHGHAPGHGLGGLALPQLGAVADFVLSGTDRDDAFADQNRFTLRSVELGLAGSVDELLSYRVRVHFDEEEIELEEAFVDSYHWLPEGLGLRAGRFNMDFGQLAPQHEHQLPFVDKPQVLQDYLGGALRGTGIELHRRTDLGDATRLRWSASIVNELDGDAHAIFGPAASHEHDDEGAEPFGDRDAENFAFGARVAVSTAACATGTLEFGASIAYAPEARRFFESGATTIARDLESMTIGADVRFDSTDAATGTGLRSVAEILFTDRENSDDGLTVTESEALGFHAYVEHLASPSWSYGAGGGRFEHADDDALDSWDVGAFVTKHIGPTNRIRLEVRHFDDPTETSIGVMLQWTVILGHHEHYETP